jgi:hypothetical protein
MGGDAMWKVMQRTRATGRVQAVLLALASWADSEGWCFPSAAQLAQRAKCSRRTVFNALEWLVQQGEIERHTKGHAQRDPIRDRAPRVGGFQATNYYRIVFIAGPAGVAKVPKRGSAAIAPPVHGTGSAAIALEVVQSATGSLCSSLEGNKSDRAERAAGAADQAITEGETVKLLTAIAHDVLDNCDAVGWTPSDLAEDVKRAAARIGGLREIYTSELIHKAVESATWQRRNLPRKAGTR